MRLVYFGSGEFAVPTLRWLLNSPHELATIVTQPDRPAGRGKKLRPTPVAERAEMEGREAVRCNDVNDPAMIERLRALRPDLGIVVAFGQKLLEPVRAAFAHGCINLHGSLLPRFRGASPVARAILEGETKTGVTVFRLVDRMDAGPILLTRETAIAPTETCGELHDRLAGICCDAIGATLKMLEADPDAPGTPQDESRMTYARKLTKADGFLSFTEPAEKLSRVVRAMWPWPGARCRYVPAGQPPAAGEEVTFVCASAIPSRADEPPGTITPVLTVATGDGVLELHSVQPAGRREMGWQDFVNGRHVKPGDRFESLAGGGVQAF